MNASDLQKNLNLTVNELEYLKNKKEIKMCIDPNFLPYEKIDTNRKHIGISADIIKIISSRIDRQITLFHTNTWKESLESFKNKKCDILPMVPITSNRKLYMDITKPYVKDSLAIVTKNDQLFINGSKDLSNKEVGIVNSYFYTEKLKQINPNIKVINVENAEDGLIKVQEGKLFAYIDALSVIAYNIQEKKIIDLKISGKLEFDIKLAIATIKEEPLLGSIMKKALDTIEKEKIKSIVGKWISINIEQSFNYRKLIYISIFFLIILGILINRNIKISRLLKKINEKNKLLEELATTDSLTKLYNRNKLDEVLLNELYRANRSSYSFGVIIIDIDFFKKVNDKYGHLIGDEILKEFANIIKVNSRKTDIAGRWGGEEFLIICTEINLQGIINFSENLRKKISSFSFSTKEQQTASFGVSIYKKNERIEDMINRADNALYKAKENGRNRVES